MNHIFYHQVIQPLLQQISDRPDNNAFFIGGKYYSYKELGECISKIRLHLHQADIKGHNICLVVNDDIESYASVFALWMEGKAYVPLHPHQPLERCLDIFHQVSSTCIIDSSADSRYDSSLTIDTSSLEFSLLFLDCDDVVPDEELAYILFTSGSTGRPKGVMISRLNLGSFMDSFWKTGIQIDHTDRCLQCFDLTFDVSIQSFLAPLVKGACVYTIPSGSIKYVSAASLIDEESITFTAMAPSMLRYLKPYYDEIDALSLKTCILTAEGSPLSLIEDWIKCATNVDLYDFYGPTEATIYCTYYKLSRKGFNKTLNGIVSIGRPMPNMSAIIVDENLNEVAAGEKGELLISGPQLAQGYFGDKEKTDKSFIYLVRNGVKERYYHTGDWCAKDEDGDIMYSGRIDNQAKIQGFRVELSEIEFHAREFLTNINAVAIPFENSSGITEIALFLETSDMSTDKLYEYLRDKMPSYMIPTRFYFEKTFPLNNNGKIDKNRLKDSIR